MWNGLEPVGPWEHDYKSSVWNFFTRCETGILRNLMFSLPYQNHGLLEYGAM
jgi:hypothetical protein